MHGVGPSQMVDCQGFSIKIPLFFRLKVTFLRMEKERLRQMIARYGGDSSLNGLDDCELEGALGLGRREKEASVPTVAGFLILGRESILREKLPGHEVAFQELDGTQVKMNDFYRFPLLRVFERTMEQF